MNLQWYKLSVQYAYTSFKYSFSELLQIQNHINKNLEHIRKWKIERDTGCILTLKGIANGSATRRSL